MTSTNSNQRRHPRSESHGKPLFHGEDIEVPVGGVVEEGGEHLPSELGLGGGIFALLETDFWAVLSLGFPSQTERGVHFLESGGGRPSFMALKKSSTAR